MGQEDRNSRPWPLRMPMKCSKKGARVFENADIVRILCFVFVYGGEHMISARLN
jgi:hypothetical protein